MARARVRSRGCTSLAIACAAATGALSIGLWAFPSEVKAIIAEAKLLANEGWIMSGTGVPTPDQDYLDDVESLYLNQFSNYTFYPLTTPEQFCPIVCNPSEPSLTFGQSVDQGVADLNSVIVPALQGGNNVAVLGYSQSATVATVEMNDLLNNTPPRSQPQRLERHAARRPQQPDRRHPGPLPIPRRRRSLQLEP